MALVTVVVQYAAIGVLIGFLFYRKELYSFFSNANKPTLPMQQVVDDSKAPKKKIRPTFRSQPPNAIDLTSTPQAISKEAEKQGNDAVFAREFAQAQKGTDLTKKSDLKKRLAKNKKPSRIINPDVAAEPSGSSVNSQVSELTSIQPPVTHESAIGSSSAGGMDTDYVRRMADSLRIAPDELLAPVPQEAEWTSVPTKSQKEKKKAERAEETKKQRQRQAQKEQYRELKEEADQKQRELMERQRRQARLARGEPAKNGEGFKDVAAPSKSAWQASTLASTGSDALLDTFDDSQYDRLEPIIANGNDHINGEDT